MKNTIKNTLAAGILTSVFVLGATQAKAGLLVSDFAPTQPTPACAKSEGTDYLTVISNAASLVGLLVSDRTGLLISDRAGILMSDRSGLLMSDRANTGSCSQ